MKGYLRFAMASASIAGLLFGVNTGNIAGALPFIQLQLHTTPFQNECIVSATVLAAACSALLSMSMSRQYGTRNMLLLSAAGYIIGAWIAGTAQTFLPLLVGRVLLGLSLGVSSYAAPLFIAELSPCEYRGFFVLLNGLAITSGEAIAYGVDYLLSTGARWHDMLFWPIYPALLFAASMLCLPNSPRWYLDHAQQARAKDILNRFHLSDKVATIIKDMSRYQRPPALAINQLLKNKKYHIPLLTAIGLGIFQQFFGINTLMYYGPYIFEKAGFSLTDLAIGVTGIMGLVNIFTTFFTALWIDYFGRRQLLLYGSWIAGVSLLLVSFCFAWNETQYIIFFMMTFIIGYCMSVGSIFWLIIAEIFPIAIKEQGACLATSAQWFSNFIVSITFLSLLNSIGPSKIFSLYACICFVAMLFVYFIVPETKRLSLESISLSYDPMETPS